MYGTRRINGNGFGPTFLRKRKLAWTALSLLGAAVLEPQQRSGLLGVEASNIIDGQQRFTTLQYFLAALAIVLRQENQATLLALADGCLWNENTDTMQQPEIEMFKVWPTFRDRGNFQLALKATNLDEL